MINNLLLSISLKPKIDEGTEYFNKVEQKAEWDSTLATSNNISTTLQKYLSNSLEKIFEIATSYNNRYPANKILFY